MKKLLSIVATAALTLSVSTVAFATTPGPTSHQVPVRVSAEAAVMDVFIPTGEIVLTVTADGDVTGTQALQITNQGTTDVKLTNATYTASTDQGSWSLVSLAEIANAAVGSNKYSGKIAGTTGFKDGDTTIDNGIVAALPSLIGLEIEAPASPDTPNTASINFSEWQASLSNVSSTLASGGSFEFTFE